jgi:hypothetical protein
LDQKPLAFNSVTAVSVWARRGEGSFVERNDWKLATSTFEAKMGIAGTSPRPRLSI